MSFVLKLHCPDAVGQITSLYADYEKGLQSLEKQFTEQVVVINSAKLPFIKETILTRDKVIELFKTLIRKDDCFGQQLSHFNGAQWMICYVFLRLENGKSAWCHRELVFSLSQEGLINKIDVQRELILSFLSSYPSTEWVGMRQSSQDLQLYDLEFSNFNDAPVI